MNITETNEMKAWIARLETRIVSLEQIVASNGDSAQVSSVVAAVAKTDSAKTLTLRKS